MASFCHLYQSPLLLLDLWFVVKNLAFDVRQIWIWLLALPLRSYGTLGQSLTLSKPQLLQMKVGLCALSIKDHQEKHQPPSRGTASSLNTSLRPCCVQGAGELCIHIRLWFHISLVRARFECSGRHRSDFGLSSQQVLMWP